MASQCEITSTTLSQDVANGDVPIRNNNSGQQCSEHESSHVNKDQPSAQKKKRPPIVDLVSSESESEEVGHKRRCTDGSGTQPPDLETYGFQQALLSQAQRYHFVKQEVQEIQTSQVKEATDQPNTSVVPDSAHQPGAIATTRARSRRYGR